MNELINTFEPEIDAITLVPSEGGRFEVTVNENLLYSKLHTHRHAEPGEVTGIVRKLTGEGV